MFDLAVIGSGFGGSLLSTIARRLGRSVLLLEKGSHPRFVIGESSTPLADLLWLDLARRYGLVELAPFAKWGTWRRAHPEVGCGLKRGFTFYHHLRDRPFAARTDRRDQLLVAASPHDEIADTHWYRPDFDHFLVRNAVRHGVEYLDRCEVREVAFDADGATLDASHAGSRRTFRARFVVDASNHRGPLARSLGLDDRELPGLPTEALYTHFRGVRRLDEMPIHDGIDTAPFPVDDAAVHHVFDGGWIWVLRFANGLTSAGVAARRTVARQLGFQEGSPAWRRLLDQLPTVAAQFAGAEPTRPWVHAPQVSFATGPAAGPRWALLPSAAGFVDPMLSSGFTLTLLGIERLAEAIDRAWNRPRDFEAALHRHAELTGDERDTLAGYLGALYARMNDFDAFTEVARLYFCAVVYCETARRLGRPDTAGGFLMSRHPEFGPAATALCRAARDGAPADELRPMVESRLARFDLAGLDEASRRPWYPVLADDLRRHRDRIGATAEEVESLLVRAGFPTDDRLRQARPGTMVGP